MNQIRFKLIPWLVLAASLSMTSLLWTYERHAVDEHLRSQFDFSLRELTGRIEQRIATYEQMLRGVRGIFPAIGLPDQGSFAAYVASLQLDTSFSGIQSIGIVDLVPKARKDEHVAAMRRQGLTDYAIFPDGNREIYAPVIQYEPRVGLELAPLGNDAWSAPERRSAMERARDSGLATMSDKTKLYGGLGDANRSEVILYLPVYTNKPTFSTISQRRANIKGWIYASLMVSDFMGSLYVNAPNGIAITIFDRIDLSDDNVLYLFPNNGDLKRPASFASTEYLEIAGHSWTISARTLQEFNARFDNGKATLTAGIGTFISILLALSAWLVTSKITTERQRDLIIAANKELGLFKAVFENTTEAVEVSDTTGRFIYTNPARDALTQSLHEAIMKMNVNDFLPPGLGALYNNLIKQSGDEAGWRGQMTLIRADGTAFVSHSNVSTLRNNDGAIIYYINILHDFTAELDRRQELDNARLVAEDATRTKSKFLAMMSHEIRTPMTGIIGMAEFLSNMEMGPEQRVYLNTLTASSRTLLAILNNILDYSKMQANRMDIEKIPFDVICLINDISRLFMGKASENSNSLIVDVENANGLIVEGDPTRIRQVLGNLLGNALKFTKQGTVTVRLRHRAHDEAIRLEFEIEDTGIGITEANLGQLFKPFSQADVGTARKFGGTGLGLAICKQLVEMMGGDISASSRLGRGSIFRFSCIVNKCDALPEEEIQPPVVIEPMDILVADDNSVNRMIIKIGLQQRGHRVSMVETGAQAYEIAASGAFDLILMDMQMPVMDGREATRMIRRLSKPFSDVPIVALTADAIVEHKQSYIEAGLNDFLTKPIDWRDVDRVLAKFNKVASKSSLSIFDFDTSQVGNQISVDKIPVLDTKYVCRIKNLMDDQEYDELINDVVSLSINNIKQLRIAAQSGDLKMRFSIIHELKGMFGNLGAMRVMAYAGKLQRTDSATDIATLIDCFDVIVNEALDELKRDSTIFSS